jgi:ribosomal-protein-alanine N-acetyltransferase
MIRKATAADAEALLALERNVAEAAHWNPAEYAAQSDRDDPLQRVILLAEENNRLLGFIVVKLLRIGREEPHAEIENLAVSLDARRQGIGSALCAAALEACSAAGAPLIELEVRAGNRAAIALYVGIGFEQVGIRTGYYANPTEDAVLLRYKQKIAG